MGIQQRVDRKLKEIDELFDEVIYKKGLLNSEISNLLKANNVNEIVYADSAEPKSIAELNSCSLSIIPSLP